MLILIRLRADVLCPPTAIMDMSGVAMGTVGLPSGSIHPPCPEAAVRVKTTSTAQGEDCVIDLFIYSFILHNVVCVFLHTNLKAFSLMLRQDSRADTDHRFNMIRIVKLNEMLCGKRQLFTMWVNKLDISERTIALYASPH